MQNTNIFAYLIFLIFSFCTAAYFEKKLLSVLSGKASQPIYGDGPSWHSKKSGTPTLGGLAFLVTSLLCLVLSSILYHLSIYDISVHLSIIISLAYSIANSLVGIFDDYTKLKRKINAGLTPMQKLVFQFILTVLFLMARAYFLLDNTSVSVFSLNIDLGILYYPFAILLLLGIVNCANLTDGIDGLASSVAFAIGIVFFFISESTSPDSAILSTCLCGISLAFLFYNVNPAKIFMGDTGSLFLGALCSCVAFSLRKPLLIVIVGGVYVIEGISVILQVLWFKLTEKRIFLMAPIHHHLEKRGFDENKICLIALFTTLVLSIFAIYL